MPETYVVTIQGAMLRRGFWLYVSEVTLPSGERALCVGRTGDSSSPNAQSPFNRLSQNLGTQNNNSMVRNHLGARGVDPIDCTLRLVGYGPVIEEPDVKDMTTHKPLRDRVGALEKRLAEDLEAAGYDVMNKVRCKAALDEHLYADVREAFAEEFPGLTPQG